MSNRTLVTLFAIPLLALSACSREKSDWRSAQAADTAESYEQFIAAHPDSSLIATARERLVQLAEEKDWRNAAGLDTRRRPTSNSWPSIPTANGRARPRFASRTSR